MTGGRIKFKSLWKSLVFILAASFLTIILTQDLLFTFAPLKELELKLIDSRFSERGKKEIKDSADVVIVEIDQETINQLTPPYNRIPLPRSIYAKLIENLNQVGVRAIGIDVIMSNPDSQSPGGDSLLFESIRKYRNVVVAGKIDESEDFRMENSGYMLSDTSRVKKFYNYENLFFSADSSIGIVQPPADFDFVYRRYIPFRVTGITDSRVPSFGFAVINKVLGLPGFATALVGEYFFELGQKKIPKYDNNSVLINFYGPSRTFNYIKLQDIIDDDSLLTKDEVDYQTEINVWDEYLSDPDMRSRLENKIVLVGSTMPEDRDILAVSFAKGTRKGDNLMHGVEFHANTIQNILWNDHITVQSVESEIILVLILTVIVFIVTSLVRKIKLRIGIFIEIINLLLIVLSVYGLYQLSIYLFINNKFLIVIVSPALALILGYIGSTAYHFIMERQQNVLIKGMFSQYVSKSIVNELLADPDKLKLGGEKKNLSVLFSDIAGFTTFAEKKEPEELVSFINEFLNEMTEIILSNGGTLDKYLGDAVMAFWGAPVEIEDHAYKACLTSLQMQDKLAELRDKWSKEGEPLIRIRIGINTGEVIVGNIGGVKRFDYTVLGDDVNLASRLEGANKEYGSNIMISDSTYQLVKEKVLVRELDIIRVKGKTEPTRVYELISLTGDQKASAAIEQMHEYFQGLELYRNKSFEPAHDYFKRCAEKLGDYPSRVYLNRCEYYLKNPPAENWDGVFEFKTK
ncbi:MAG TPA: CHASE2 domain-containing protein [Melioribacteraceae bacterium]|nr:CHASE2 domain-containing protein [Melioribacteraceae bacterium]